MWNSDVDKGELKFFIDNCWGLGKVNHFTTLFESLFYGVEVEILNCHWQDGYEDRAHEYRAYDGGLVRTMHLLV